MLRRSPTLAAAHLGAQSQAVLCVSIKEAKDTLLGKCRVQVPDKGVLVFTSMTQKDMVLHLACAAHSKARSLSIPSVLKLADRPQVHPNESSEAALSDSIDAHLHQSRTRPGQDQLI